MSEKQCDLDIADDLISDARSVLFKYVYNDECEEIDEINSALSRVKILIGEYQLKLKYNLDKEDAEEQE